MDRQTKGPSLRTRWLAVGTLGLILVATQSVASWRDSHALLINSSESLPNWAFFIEKNKTPERGDYVFFKLIPTAITRAHWGDNAPSFGKVVYGLPGDIVSRQGSTVFVNGKPVATLKPKSKRGEILVPGPIGIIPRDHFFLATAHKDGFDSRYADIGFVPRRQIIGTVDPIL